MDKVNETNTSLKDFCGCKFVVEL